MGKEQRCGGDLLHGGGGGGELIKKILNRLPVKTLGRFKLVSKSWCAIIESPFFFIDDHLHTNNTFILLVSHIKYSPKTVPTSSPEHSLIMISPESESVDSVSRSSSGSSDGCCVWSTCSNPHYQDDDDQLVFKVNNNNNSGGGQQQQQQQQQQLVFKLDSLGFPKFEDFSKSVSDLGLPEAFQSVEFSKKMIGSCNGLVCLYDSILNEVSLWNPATRQFKILPRAIKIVKDDLPKHLVGFGFDVETKDYKVVLLTGFRSDSHYRPKTLPIECICRVQVYSLSTDSWRLLEGITSLPGYPFFSYGTEVVCLNGSCFFLAHFFHTKQQRCIAENNRFIISFDFTKEIFTPIQLPDHHRHQKLYLSCLGGDKMALFTVCCNPPPGGDSYNPDIYELPEPPANYSCYPESHEPARGIFYSQICGSEDYNIWVLDEHVSSSSSSSSVNKESWRQLHSFQIEHQRPGEWTSPSCISNDGEFVLLKTRNSYGLGKKMKLYNLVTKEVKKGFLSCSRVMSKAYAYKPSLVKLMVDSSMPTNQA